MYGKANKPGTLQTAQMMCEKEDSSMVGDCMTRMMTPEDWEKYGPLNIIESKECQKSKARRGFSQRPTV